MKRRLGLLLSALLTSGLVAQPAPPPAPPGAPPPPPLPAAPGNSNTADPLEDLNVAPPAQAGAGGTVPAPATTGVSDPWTTLEAMLGRIQTLQKQALDGIETYKKSQDDAERMMVKRDVQVWHGTVEGMLLSSTWKDTVEKVRKTDDLAKTKDARYLAMFGDKGHLPTVDRNQEILRAFLKDPGAPASAQGDSIAELQRQIDQISLELAKPGLTELRRGELEAERTRLVERIRALSQAGATAAPTSTAASSGTPSATEPAAGATGATGSTGTTAEPAAPAGGTGEPTVPPQAGNVPLVPNSYGIAPAVLSDAQIRARLDPLIDKELAAVNAKSGTGLQMNKYRQMTGSSGKTTVKSVGRPDGDHYREWLKAAPQLKAELDGQAQAIYIEKAKTLAPRTPAPNPPSQGGGVDLPSSSAER